MFFRRASCHGGAVAVVVVAIELEEAFAGEVAFVVDIEIGGDFHHVLFGGRDGGDAEVFAFRRADDDAAVAEIGGEELFRGFVGGIHEDVFAALATHGGDGVVEVGERIFRILQRSGVDEHGICVDVGHAEHGDEEAGLVAADAVAVVEREGDVVRLVAGGVLFKRDAHVADFLRDELEDGLDLLVFILRVFAELLDFRDDFRSVDEMLRVDFPEPLGDFLPAGGGADAKALHDARKRRHVRLGEHARDILHRPFVEDAAVLFLLLMRDRAGDFVLQGDAA